MTQGADRPKHPTRATSTCLVPAMAAQRATTTAVSKCTLFPINSLHKFGDYLFAGRPRLMTASTAKSR